MTSVGGAGRKKWRCGQQIASARLSARSEGAPLAPEWAQRSSGCRETPGSLHLGHISDTSAFTTPPSLNSPAGNSKGHSGSAGQFCPRLAPGDTNALLDGSLAPRCRGMPSLLPSSHPHSDVKMSTSFTAQTPVKS